MKTTALLAALMMASLVLAGCTSNGDGTADADGSEVDPTLGGIAGLLVDDNFRPVQLKEAWGTNGPGEYQDKGFILVEETAERVETNENGEFEVTGMKPGTYTLRVSAEGHEAVTKAVEVETGELSSITLEARRKATDTNPVVTTEYAIFISCNVYATFDCTFDNSGDSSRPGIRDNFSEYAEDVTFMTWEILLNNPYIFCLEVRERSGNTGASLDRHFGNWCEGQDSTYTKGILQKDEIYNEKYSQDPWDPTAETDGILFTFGNNEATCWAKPGNPGVGPEQVEAGGETVNNPTHNTDGRYRCAGVAMAVKAQIVSSLFLYDVEADEVEDYCVICESG